ncbi:MAG TPA: hypothetical protein VHU44_05285 [Acidobacteriaceae bacterium]|jgi:hypothetical protein|nr:hypothetical protein [Acidobacteriaceae bacterium]
MNAQFLKAASALTLCFALLAGCKSKQDEAIDQARKQAAATGQAQQVVSVDKNGTTTTTVVQPNGQQTTTTTTPAPSTNPTPGNPTVTPVGGPGTAFTNTAGAPAPDNSGAPAPQPVPGGAPVVKPADVNIPAGTTLAIRINQHISVKTTPAGSRFTGEIAEGYTDANGHVILPRGTPVAGVVEESHKRGRFKGASVLDLRLTSLSLNGQSYPLATRDVVRTKKGKGKRSGAFIGGGAGLGALIGGLAGGGKGALIGAGAGAGAGTAGAAFTGNSDLDIPSESVIRFRLADDLTLQS